MLFKSKYNLESSAISFLRENEEATLFSAYIKTAQLKKINETKSIKQIVVRWEVGDICFEASDLESLYDYCIDNKIKLLRNNKIHLKAFWNNNNSVLFGSANVTYNGIGEGGNLELNGLQENISFNDKKYFNEIILKSNYVTKEKVLEIRQKVDEQKSKVVKIEDIKSEIEDVPCKETLKDSFLISQLPMSFNIFYLYESYLKPELLSLEDTNCLAHDLVLYDIPNDLQKDEFYSILKENFNKHPFILKLKEFIKSDSRQSLGYGRVVSWIKDKTTTVPTPRSFELKEEQIVNILYEWICFFDEEWSWSRPTWSQVIKFNINNNDLSVTDFLNQLNRNQTKGFKSPHQIILLMLLSDLHSRRKFRINVEEIKEKFNSKWNLYLENNSISNSMQNFGLPLKAFFSSGLLQFDIDGKINDRTWKSNSELIEKIKSIRFTCELSMIFDQIDNIDILENYLE